VVYFDKQENALPFTLAASSVMSPGDKSYRIDEGVKLAEEICNASRIKAEGLLNMPSRMAPK